MIYILNTCRNVNEVLDALVEVIRKFVICATVDIKKNSIGEMAEIRKKAYKLLYTVMTTIKKTTAATTMMTAMTLILTEIANAEARTAHVEIRARSGV